MDDSQLFGIGITILISVIGLPWARHSLRRLFLVAAVLGISVGIRIGTTSGGIYPYELLVVICGMFLFTHLPGSPAMFTSRMSVGLGLLAAWWIAGVLINVLIRKPDLQLMVNMGQTANSLQFKLFGHLLLTILECGIAFWAGGRLFDPDFDTELVFSGVICGTTLVCAVTLIEWIKTTGGVVARYNFLPPTDLGQGGTSQMLLAGTACCLILLLAARGNRLILGGLLLLHCTAILVIQTRLGYIAALIYLTVLTPLCGSLLLNRRRKAQLIVATPFLIVVLAAVLGQVLLRSGFFESFTSLTNADMQDRANKTRLINAAEDIFRAHPLIGVGRGQFTIYSDVPMVVSGQNVYVATPHNGLLELLAETGLLGAIFAYGLQIWLCWRLWRVYMGNHPPLTRAVGGMVAFMVSFVTLDSIVQSNLMFPTPEQRDFVREAFVYWFLAGFASGARTWELAEAAEQNWNSAGLNVVGNSEWENQW
jgi:hypothetical protein